MSNAMLQPWYASKAKGQLTFPPTFCDTSSSTVDVASFAANATKKQGFIPVYILHSMWAAGVYWNGNIWLQLVGQCGNPEPNPAGALSLAHELGHALNLAHPAEDPVMRKITTYHSPLYNHNLMTQPADSEGGTMFRLTIEQIITARANAPHKCPAIRFYSKADTW